MSNVAVTNVATKLKYGNTLENGFLILPHQLRDHLFQADISSGALKMVILLLGFMKSDRTVTIRQQTILKIMNYSSNSRTMVFRWNKELVAAGILEINSENTFEILEYDFNCWINSVQKNMLVDDSIEYITKEDEHESLQNEHILKEEFINKDFKDNNDLNELTSNDDFKFLSSDQTVEIAQTLAEELDLIMFPNPIDYRPIIPASDYGADIFSMILNRYRNVICPDIIRMLTPIHKNRIAQYLKTGRNVVIHNPVGWFDGLIKEAICQFTYLKNLPEEKRQSVHEKLMTERWKLLRSYNLKMQNLKNNLD